MANNKINKLLSGKYIDIDSGKYINIPIREIVIARDIGSNSGSLVNKLNLGKKVTIVSDSNVFNILGEIVKEKLEECFDVATTILPEDVEASEDYISTLYHKCNDADFIVAVGSGTINDLCKYYSFKVNKPYVVFGTAPSMNGYASANTSILSDGIKQTMPAHLPTAIYLDLDILANAPQRLIQSGVGDSLCRSTAQADWLLSHYIMGTEYKSTPFELLYDDEKALFDNVAKLMSRDISTIERLANILILSGLGMYISGGSYPASQGEHLIAHYIEMNEPAISKQTFHGEQIGVTTLYMAKLQQKILAMDNVKIHPYSAAGKTIDEVRAEALNSEWQNIRANIKSMTYSTEKLKNILKTINLPTTYQELGWSDDLFSDAVENAHLIRDRFTFLDMRAIL